MKKLFSFFNLGVLILFLGLIWMFLPHAAHGKIISSYEETSHIIHIFEGFIFALVGLVLMIYHKRKISL